MFKVGDFVKTRCLNDGVIRVGKVINFLECIDCYDIQMDDKKYNCGYPIGRSSCQLELVGANPNSKIIVK